MVSKPGYGTDKSPLAGPSVDECEVIRVALGTLRAGKRRGDQ
jgi:hypothetical protein